METLDNLLWR